jgi:hypothetical protein
VVSSRHCRFVIGVAGGTASGKTTFCESIIQRLHDQCVVMLNQVGQGGGGCRGGGGIGGVGWGEEQ